MANLKPSLRNIALENVQAEFGKTKTYPKALIMPEMQKPFCYVFENGAAEIQFFVRTDMEPTTGAMQSSIENAPGFWVEAQLSKEQLLDCIAHSGLFDVVGGGVGVDISTPTLEDAGATHYQKIDLSEDFVRSEINDNSPYIIESYICLFGADAIAQSRAEYIEETQPKSFTAEMEAVLNEAGLAIAA